MKILVLFNEYRATFGGEYKVIADLKSLYERHQIEAIHVTRSSKDLNLADKCRAFVHGIYSIPAKREMVEVLDAEQPDLVHAHNLHPFFSPSVLVACRKARVPVVMTVHNFSFTCPHWSHFLRGEICERCVTGSEMWCVIKNCQDNIFESTGYALRGAFARTTRIFQRNVTTFISLSSFAKERMIAAGFDPSRIVVLPNSVNLPDHVAPVADGAYVAFSGRLSPEKGVEDLVEAAKLNPDIPIGIAGDGPLMEQLKSHAPPNVRFHGLLASDALADFYNGARMLVVPSRCFEMCPIAILEGMSHGLPIIASRLGAMPELVQNDTNGTLFDPGNPVDLASKIKLLWSSPDTCVKMGNIGRQLATKQYNVATYEKKLMDIYQEAIARGV